MRNVVFNISDERNLPIKLIQKYGMPKDIAEHLVGTYGGQVWDICEISQHAQKRIHPGFPYIEAEIIYACREYACTIEDILSRRTRLAFLNKEAAVESIPKVAKVMADELGWSQDIIDMQIVAATKYVESYSGSLDNKAAMVREASPKSFQDVFSTMDLDGSGFVDIDEVHEIAAILGFEMAGEDIKAAFKEMDKDNNGRVSIEAFGEWWEHSSDSPLHKKLSKELGLLVKDIKDLKESGGGVMFG